MKALVTGAAGFVGSTLAEALVEGGWEVRGVDALIPYYDLRQKEANLAEVLARGIDVRRADLRTADLDDLLEGVDVVFHQAGQPGVRSSWDEFDPYLEHNVTVTRRLLETARRHRLTRFVYASSSSVYGNAGSYPTTEETLPAPFSPYGVTKLAAEHLVGVFAHNWGVPAVSLRYFTVYGPRQRPDMAMHRLIGAALDGSPFPRFGSGDQIRDFTFVGDVVAANLAAAVADIEPGRVFNICGGGSVSLNQIIGMVESLTGRPVEIDRRPAQPGDVDRTGGSSVLAASVLGWHPRVDLGEGLRRQVEWQARR